jgi:DHA1 family tetracycline resistance protein-like MFS transporter
MRRETYIIFFTVLVDVVGFGIVIPILPFYVTEFGVSPTVVTLLFASFSFFSFLSAPLLGSLSDRIGRRPVIILSIISTAIGWFVFASASAVWMLFLGRIIDGAAAGNFTSAQGYMVDIAKDERERTRNLGILSAIFGIGFLLGPILGGLLSRVSHVFPFWVAGILASVNAVSAVLFLPESHRTPDAEKRIDYHPLAPLVRAWRDTALRPLYVTWTAFALAFVIGQSVFALFVKDVFGFTAFATGMSFAFIGVVVVLNQVILLQRFWLRKFNEARLQILMLVILALGLLCIAVEILPLFYVGLLGLGTGQAVLRVVVTSQVAGGAGPLRRGESIGILSAIMSASMVVAPVVAGILFEINHVTPYILAILVLLAGLVELWKHPQKGVVVPATGAPREDPELPGS